MSDCDSRMAETDAIQAYALEAIPSASKSSRALPRHCQSMTNPSDRDSAGDIIKFYDGAITHCVILFLHCSDSQEPNLHRCCFVNLEQSCVSFGHYTRTGRHIYTYSSTTIG
jgi:hypothetical protein